MAIKFELSKFPVAFPAKVIARDGGAHMYSIQHDGDLWNGAVIAKGDYKALDLYTEGTATKINAKVVGQAANGNYYVEITKDSPALRHLSFTIHQLSRNSTISHSSLKLIFIFLQLWKLELIQFVREIFGSFLRLHLQQNLQSEQLLYLLLLARSGQLRNFRKGDR